MNRDRRTFLKKAALGTAGAFAIPTVVPSYLLGNTAPSNRINVAMIGIGRQTVNPNIPQFLTSSHAQIVAVCDVDSWRVGNGRIGKVQRIFVAVPSDGPPLPVQPTMPVHCNGMISNWGAHLMGIVQWGNNTEYTGPISIEGTGEFDKGLWNTLNKFDIKYRYANGVEVFFKIERPYVRFEGTDGWIEVEYSDKLTASSQAILDSPTGAGEISFKDLPSDKEDFLPAIKNGKQTIEPLETAHRTISMCQLGLISIKTGSPLTWNPETEEITNDNAASALLNIPIREKYFKF